MAPPGADSWASRHRIELGLTLRMSVAGLLSFAVAQLFQVTQVYWAVLTAVIVMQASVGGSLKAMLDRFVGTLGGAVWGVAVTIVLPHPGIASTGIALAVALIPLALLVAFRPAYRVAPVTAAIVLLGRPVAGGVIAAALDRVFEIGLGSIVALAVALWLAPMRAHQTLYAAGRDALTAMAAQIAGLLAGMTAPVDRAATLALHDRARAAIERAAAAADETARERRSYVSDTPDPEPVVRTLRRLSHDLVIIARALPTPLPAAAGDHLCQPAADLATVLGDYMPAIGDSLVAGTAPPDDAPPSRVFDAYAAAVAALRHSGATRALTDDDVERIFGLSFGLEQLRHNLADMAARVAELARR
jgi:uncharacterized membrane protein YccC